MPIKTYRAPTPAQALASVKKDLGSEAVILSTRTYKAGGVFGLAAKTITEITATTSAAAGNSPAPRPARTTARVNRTEARPVRGESATATLEREANAVPRDRVAAAYSRFAASADEFEDRATPSPRLGEPKPEAECEPDSREPKDESAARSASDAPTRSEQREAAAHASPAPPRMTQAASLTSTIESTPTPPAPDLSSLEAELSDLRRLMGKVLTSSRRGAPAGLSEHLETRYHALLEAELCPDIADDVVRGVMGELGLEEIDDEGIVREAVIRRLASVISADAEQARATPPEGGGPLVIALVGPTGVGKTTTLAKLAATYKLRHGKSVGLITSDTYRIAAVDQLRTYANIIGLPVRVALTPAEMAHAVGAMSEHDVVLIDTAGRSQHDAQRIDELSGFLSAARPHRTHLVLSATCSEQVLRRTCLVFSTLELSHAIVTKLDEAVTLGPVINSVRSLGKPLSFVTTGQEVPEQIETASATRLARRLLATEAR